MSIKVTIITECDDWDDRFSLERLIASHRYRYTVKVDSLNHMESALADEIDEDDDVPTEDDEVMVLRILQGAQQRMAGQGAAIQAQQLDELIHALQAPPAQRREELINPLKMERPTGEPPTNLKKFEVKPTDESPGAKALKRTIIREIACPKCGQPAGKACQSPTHQDYGAGHVHAARIAAWQAQ